MKRHREAVMTMMLQIGHVFNPSEIGIMQAAMKQATNALAFAFRENDKPDAITREELACAILHYAARGEMDTARLTARALHDLAPRPAYWVVRDHQTRNVA